MTLRGFILQPTYRVEEGGPVVHLFGRLETGEAFLVRDTRPIPHFFIRSSDAGAARAVGASRQTPTELRTFRGEPVVRVDVRIPQDTPPLRDSLQARGIPVLEADVRFAMRYLIDRGLRGVVAISPRGSGEGVSPAACGSKGGPSMRVFQDPTVSQTDWRPAAGLLRALSLDIETDALGRRLFSVAIAGVGEDEVMLALTESQVKRGLGRASHSARVTACGDERGLLKTLAARLRATDFDILTGWNVIDFDLDVLLSAARRCGVSLDVGRGPGGIRLVKDRSFWGRSRAEITGRIVLDGIELLRGAFVKLDDYRLDTAARAILGEGKLALEKDDRVPGEGSDRARAIEAAFRKDLPRFVAYNLSDARLVLGILERAGLLELAIQRSLLTGMPLDRVGASIASFDSLYLGELRARGYVAPSVGRDRESEPTAGGAVLEPSPGMYENILAFDFKSLYPSLIRTFNIDPLGHEPDPRPEEAPGLIRAPNGAYFRREPGILPEILKDLFPRREEAKRRGDAIAAQAMKILMNSCYGVLATPACRFYSSAVANAITHFGQWALRWARDQVNAWGHRVLYGDTDSLFVTSGIEGRGHESEALRIGADLCERINEALRKHIHDTWKVESHLEIEFEALFLKFFLPSTRHGGAGARKRYAGLLRKEVGGATVDETVFVGMEVVRRDWTDLSKIFQRGLYERLFHGAGPGELALYLRGFVRDLRAGRHDGNLVYRKALRKDLAEYTATTPPHVKAARKMGRTAPRLIEYVMTCGGPEPVAALSSPIDYGHYVERQIRPIAEQVLPHVGVSFEDALGEVVQGSLF